MGTLGVMLVLLLLIAIFGIFNFLQANRVEKAQEEWFKRILPKGEDRASFLAKSPFEYRPLAGKGYGILDKRTGQEVWKAKTPEEAEGWIVTNTLAEQGKLPGA